VSVFRISAEMAFYAKASPFCGVQAFMSWRETEKLWRKRA
jgi:hypothetical protein